MLNNFFNKINFKKLREVKGFSIIIVPSDAGADTKSRHLSSGKFYSILFIYSLVVFFVGFLLLNLTPLKGLIFSNTALSSSDKKMVNELNQKLIFLTNELESLKTTNQQLKNAIMLGDSSLVDSSSNKIYNNNGRNPFGGNILAAFEKLFLSGNTHATKEVQFTIPLNGFISRGFNPEDGHMGIDIVAKIGSPVYAAASGYVVFSGYTVRDGYMIILAHSDGYITVYKHCSQLLKQQRDKVNEGEIIALSGNSGEITTGPHLHFEVWKNGKPIDPKKVLNNF